MYLQWSPAASSSMLAIRSATDAAGDVFLKDALVALLDRPAPGPSLLAWAPHTTLRVWPRNSLNGMG